MFYDSKFIGNISKWNVSNVENMSSMFAYSQFDGNISNWNVSNVKDMSNMFTNSPLQIIRLNGISSKLLVSASLI